MISDDSHCYRYYSVGERYGGIIDNGIEASGGDIIDGGDDGDGSGLGWGTDTVFHDVGDHIQSSGACCHGEGINGSGISTGRKDSFVGSCAGPHGCCVGIIDDCSNISASGGAGLHVGGDHEVRSSMS